MVVGRPGGCSAGAQLSARFHAMVDGWSITFEDVSVNVVDDESPGGIKQILRGVTGGVPAGSVVAVMGPTGSGKTTLLNALAHRGPAPTGEILFSGKRWSPELRRGIGFVEQDDIVIDELTVRESLHYMARLRLPRALDAAAKAARVDEIIAMLALGKAAYTKVAQISGGERKRLCIGQELLSSPKVLLELLYWLL